MKRLWVVMLVLLCVAPVFGQFHKAFVPDLEATDKVACDAVMKDILGSILVSYMAEGVMIEELQDRDLGETGELRQKGYLKKPVVKPTPGCSYSSVGDLAGKGYITCAVHGQAKEYTSQDEFRQFEKKAGLLLFSGADINERNEAGQTAVHVAVEKGKALILEYLISKGANLSLPDRLGKTPLRQARDAGKSELAQILASHGAQEDPGESTVGTPLSAGSIPLSPTASPSAAVIPDGARPSFTIEEANEHGRQVIFWDSVQGALGKTRRILDDLKVFDGQSNLLDSEIPEADRKTIREIRLRMQQALVPLEHDYDRFGMRGTQPRETIARAEKNLEELTREVRDGTKTVETVIGALPNVGLKTRQYIEYLAGSWEGPFYLPQQRNERKEGSVVYAGSASELKASIAERIDLVPKMINNTRNLLRMGSLFEGKEASMNFSSAAVSRIEGLIRNAETIPVRLKAVLERLTVRGVLTQREVDEANAASGLLNQEAIKLDFQLGEILQSEFSRIGISDSRKINDLCMLLYDGKFGEASRIIREQTR